MIDDGAVREENAALRRRIEQLLRRATDAEQAMEAFARGEVDAVATQSASTPLLLRAAQDGLRHSQALLRAVFDGAADVMILVDDRDVFVDVNRAACALFELGPEELLGRGIAEFASPDDAQTLTRAWREDARTRGLFALRRRDGARRTLEYSAVASVAPGLHLLVLRDITERVAAEEALRRSEARFRALVEKSTEAISLTSADGTTRYLTPSISRLIGWTAEELGSRTPRDLVVTEDRVALEASLARAIRSGSRDLSNEFRIRHRDGSIRWIEASGTNLLEDPDVRAIVGNYRDITARKHAEAALRESREWLEEAQAIAHVGSWTSGFGPDGAITWSRECYRIFDIPEGTPMTVTTFFAHVHPDDRERLQRATRAAIDEGAPADIEHRITRADGGVRHVHERGVVERDPEGRPLRMIGTLQDITDQTVALVALRASEERYRTIIETTSEGVWMSDRTFTTTFVNQTMADMLGYARQDILGVPVFGFLTEAGAALARIKFEERRHGRSLTYENSYRRKDGTTLWALAKTNPVLDAGGHFAGTVALLTDMTERRASEEARNRLVAIVESLEDAVVSVGLDGMVTSWNAGAERLFQYSTREMMGISIDILADPSCRGDAGAMISRAALGEAIAQHETQRRRKDGSSVDVAVTYSPVRGAGGAVVGVSKIARDLTAHKQSEAALRRTEEQFRQAQKMEAVGRLAAGVAHDFNNLLSVIVSYSELALGDLKRGDPMRADLEQVEHAGLRAAELTRQLLAFSRQQFLQPQVIDLSQIVTGVERMLRRLLGADIDVALILGESLERVLADPGQIEQVVMNLAVNARDAIAEGGNLTIETANVELHAGDLDLPAGVKPGHFVMLAVRDTGMGMDAATRARIFEPFFTTKEQGKGTGLGLSTVFGIVEQSGGFVSVASEPGRGSTFKVYLPPTDGSVPTALSQEPVVNVNGGTETILLAEDEDQVRAVACAILRRNGYHVIDTSNAGEAFLASNDFAGDIHLLLTDVVMPRMNGRKLAEQLAPRRPTMRVLFVSGYTDDSVVLRGVTSDSVSFLQKPFTPETLLRKVREVLDAGLRRSRDPGVPPAKSGT